MYAPSPPPVFLLSLFISFIPSLFFFPFFTLPFFHLPSDSSLLLLLLLPPLLFHLSPPPPPLSSSPSLLLPPLLSPPPPPPPSLLPSYLTPFSEYLIFRGQDTCEHHCLPVGSNNLFTKMEQLPDGTPCSTGSPGVCLRGKCVPVGCDYQLNATAHRDHCGVWCGDGSSCIQFSGTYSTMGPPRGSFES